MEVLEFNKKIVDEVASQYQKVSLDPKYRALLENIASIMQHNLGMSELAVRGFISQSIVEWQTRHKKEINSVLKMSVEERKRFMKEGFDIFYHIISEKVLKKPENKPRLKSAIDDAYKVYETKFLK